MSLYLDFEMLKWAIGKQFSVHLHTTTVSTVCCILHWCGRPKLQTDSPGGRVCCPKFEFLWHLVVAGGPCNDVLSMAFEVVDAACCIGGRARLRVAVVHV